MTDQKNGPAMSAAPPKRLRAMALALILEEGHTERDILGPSKARFAFATRLRWKVIAAAREKWPRASINSIARALELDHTTVRNALGIQRRPSSGRNAGGRNHG